MDGLKGDVRMAANVASIIAELADSMLNRPEKVHSCILSEVFGELCNELLAFILNDNIESETDLSRVRVSGFSALYNLLQYAPQDWDTELIKIMNHVFEMLERSVEFDDRLDTKQEELQGFFFWALQCILTSVQCHLPDDHGTHVVELIIRAFNQRGDIFDEAFLALSAIANKFPDALNRKVEDLGPFIVFGLKSSNAAIIRNACGVLSDLCTLTESPGIIQGFSEYMPILLEHLKASDTEKSVKVIIISLIGDTFLLTKDRFSDFFEESLNLLESAAKVAVKIPEDYEEKPEYMRHLSQLQSGLIESYTCFVQNIQETEDVMYQTLGQFIYNIFAFAMNTVDEKFHPTMVSKLF